LDDGERGMFTATDHHLGDALSILHDKGFVAPVDQDDPDLTTIVTVDGSGAVEHPYPMAKSQAAAWANLGFEARR